MKPEEKLVDSLLKERNRLGAEDDELFLQKLENALESAESEEENAENTDDRASISLPTGGKSFSPIGQIAAAAGIAALVAGGVIIFQQSRENNIVAMQDTSSVQSQAQVEESPPSRSNSPKPKLGQDIAEKSSLPAAGGALARDARGAASEEMDKLPPVASADTDRPQKAKKGDKNSKRIADPFAEDQVAEAADQIAPALELAEGKAKVIAEAEAKADTAENFAKQLLKADATNFSPTSLTAEEKTILKQSLAQLQKNFLRKRKTAQIRGVGGGLGELPTASPDKANTAAKTTYLPAIAILTKNTSKNEGNKETEENKKGKILSKKEPQPSKNPTPSALQIAEKWLKLLEETK